MLSQFDTIPDKAESVQKCKVSDISFHLFVLKWVKRFGKVGDKSGTAVSPGFRKEVSGGPNIHPCSIQKTDTLPLHALLFKKSEIPAG